jgi:hypothetical protein
MKKTILHHLLKLTRDITNNINLLKQNSIWNILNRNELAYIKL